ncbi:WXG100 family type VII secretion target [Nocardia brevicatena]|uniref:WXG100 family type VII secretion target n=1 Tax=Nocardia brevicatena TaxID=37327 RepID=UPI0002D5F854|nr:WXG100 family type VII secretion target [Nocardia brevicatena]
MGDPVAADPEQLRDAAGRLDTLFDEAGTALRETDEDIADSREGWKAEASTAFGRFAGYLDERRGLLQQNLAEMAELLKTTANTLESQDGATANVVLGLPKPGTSSLNI